MTVCIQSLLGASKDKGLDTQFLWIHSHIGFNHHVDKMGKQACLKPDVNLILNTTSNVVKSIVTKNSINSEMLRDQVALTSSIMNGIIPLNTYSNHKSRTRHCDFVTAKITIRYRYIWQIARDSRVDTTLCKLWDAPYNHTLQHYTKESPFNTDFKPLGLRFYELCKLLILTYLRIFYSCIHNTM